MTLRRQLYFRLFGGDSALRRLVRPDMRVLDVGCSDGRGSEVLSRLSAAGVDIYRPALQVARQQGHRSLVCQADVRALPYRSGSFDAVVALDVIEHFEKEDALRLLNEMERVSRDGVIVLTPNGFVPQPPTEDEPWQEHRSGFESDELRALGYEVVGVGGVARLRAAYGAFRGGLLGMVAALPTIPYGRRRPTSAFHLLAVRRGLGG
jgi:SAM-dependent methyltransferase